MSENLEKEAKVETKIEPKTETKLASKSKSEIKKSTKLNEKNAWLSKALSLVGQKFVLEIIDSIASNNNKTGFNSILKSIPEANPRIISIRLKSLEANKLVSKSIVLGYPIKTEYSLTPKALKLEEIISKLKDWVQEK
jgi:DNA-binding HxlR family transcriptional regulator